MDELENARKELEKNREEKSVPDNFIGLNGCAPCFGRALFLL